MALFADDDNKMLRIVVVLIGLVQMIVSTIYMAAYINETDDTATTTFVLATVLAALVSFGNGIVQVSAAHANVTLFYIVGVISAILAGVVNSVAWSYGDDKCSELPSGSFVCNALTTYTQSEYDATMAALGIDAIASFAAVVISAVAAATTSK